MSPRQCPSLVCPRNPQRGTKPAPFPCRNLHAEVTELVMVELGSNLLTLNPLCVSAPREPPLPQLGDSSQWSAVSSLVTKGGYSHTMLPVRKSFCGHSWRACQRPRFQPRAPTTWQRRTGGPHGVSLSGAVLRQDGLNRFMALSPPSRHTGQGHWSSGSSPPLCPGIQTVSYLQVSRQPG